VEIEKWWAPIVPLMAAILGALADVQQRFLGKDIHFTIPPLYLGLTCGIATHCYFLENLIWEHFDLFKYGTYYSNNIYLYIWICCQMLFTIAFQIEKAGRLSAISYISIVFAWFIDFLVLILKEASTILLGFSYCWK